MSITTRAGYRKSQVAKRYQAKVWQEDHRKVDLRTARKAVEAQQEVICTLKPLTQKQRVKVIRAVKILLELE